MRPPVRLFSLALAVASLFVFMFSLGWGSADRRRAAAAPPPAKPAPMVVQPAPSQTTPKPRNQVSQQKPPTAAPKMRSHRVEQGDSLWEIASRYGITLEDLLTANPEVGDPGHLQIGQELEIPPGSAVKTASAASVDPKLSLGGLFVWPNSAEVSSVFGPRWGRNHNGIDLKADHGDPIRAARSGRVDLAGEVKGYGNTVIISHPDGTRTLYAHASKLLVSAGQDVKQGELIALVGSTGNSTGPHLHFEIIVNDRPQDPLLYLPKK